MISVAGEIPVEKDLQRHVILDAVLSRKPVFDEKTAFEVNGKKFHFADKVTIFDEFNN
jgi:hypothetical protein